MTIDYEWWRFWLGILQLVVTVFIGVYVWWTGREKVTATRFQALENEVAKRATGESLEELREKLRQHQESRCNEHLRRTSTLEVKFDKAPSHNDLGDLHDRITTVKGSVDEMNGHLKALVTQVRLLVEHHMNGDRR